MRDPGSDHYPTRGCRTESRTGAWVAVMWDMVDVSRYHALMHDRHNDCTGASQAKLGFVVAVPDRLAELGPPALGGMYIIDMHVCGR